VILSYIGAVAELPQECVVSVVDLREPDFKEYLSGSMLGYGIACCTHTFCDAVEVLAFAPYAKNLQILTDEQHGCELGT
jgi:hypothetical protein